MTMTRKHFKAIAEVINDSLLDDDSKSHIAHKLCYIMRQFNTNFNGQKFVEACTEANNVSNKSK